MRPWVTALDCVFADGSRAELRRAFDKRGITSLVDHKLASAKADLAERNLILWGDAGSNKLIAELSGKLPVTYADDQFTFAGKSYDAKACALGQPPGCAADTR